MSGVYPTLIRYPFPPKTRAQLLAAEALVFVPSRIVDVVGFSMFSKINQQLASLVVVYQLHGMPELKPPAESARRCVLLSEKMLCSTFGDTVSNSLTACFDALFGLFAERPQEVGTTETVHYTFILQNTLEARELLNFLFLSRLKYTLTALTTATAEYFVVQTETVIRE